jgi:hypothetical protein
LFRKTKINHTKLHKFGYILIKRVMKICENCGINHEGNYGSGRFCNDKCAKSFSTKQKRKEINEKVSNTLLIKNTKDVRFCEFCGDEK